MLPEIEDLFSRMTAREGQIGPGGVSWDAHREAEAVTNLDWLPHLADEANRSKDKDRRRVLYFILSHLGKNTGSGEVADLLLARLPFEKNYFVLHCLFGALARLPQISDCTAIIPYLGDRRWQVAAEAMNALHRCTSPLAEDALLQVLPSHTDPFILSHGHAALGAIGTAKSIPYLCGMIHHPKEDVKWSAIHALGRLGDASLTPVFLDALSDRSSGTKWVAMLGLARHGDASAMLAVVERARAIAAKKRKLGQQPKSEFVAAVEYLNRFVEADPRISGLFQEIKQKRWGNLFDDERLWLQRNIPAFRDAGL